MQKEAEPDDEDAAAISEASSGGSLCSLRIYRPFGKALTEQPDGTDDKADAEDRRRQPEEQECGIKAEMPPKLHARSSS